MKVDNSLGEGQNSGVQISANDVRGNSIGIWQTSGAAADAVIARNNALTGNTRGAVNDDTAIALDARCNWWGAANGPSGTRPGSGDSITSGVTFQSWLTSLAGACNGPLGPQGPPSAPPATPPATPPASPPKATGARIHQGRQGQGPHRRRRRQRPDRRRRRQRHGAGGKGNDRLGAEPVTTAWTAAPATTAWMAAREPTSCWAGAGTTARRRREPPHAGGRLRPPHSGSGDASLHAYRQRRGRGAGAASPTETAAATRSAEGRATTDINARDGSGTRSAAAPAVTRSAPDREDRVAKDCERVRRS